MKKIMLMIIAVVLLVGIWAIAEEGREDRPRDREAVRERQIPRVRAEAGRGEREREVPEVRRREVVRESEGREIERGREVAPRPQRQQDRRRLAQPFADQQITPPRPPMDMPGRPFIGRFGGRPGPFCPWGNTPQARIFGNRPGMGQMAGEWLDELTNAYRENDREKMGQLIRQMHQFRQRLSASGGREPVGPGRGRQGGAGPGLGRGTGRAGRGMGIRGGGWGVRQPGPGWIEPGQFQPPVRERQEGILPERMERPRVPMLPEGPVFDRGTRGPGRRDIGGLPQFDRPVQDVPQPPPEVKRERQPAGQPEERVP